MKNKQKYIYVATDNEGVVICVADDLTILEQLVFKYFGYPQTPEVQFLGYEEYDNCGHYDVYEGFYSFVTEYIKGDVEKSTIYRYCLPLNQLYE